MKNIVLGQYIPGNGFFYRMDPRTKIIGLVLLMISLFLIESLLGIGIALFMAFFLLFIGKMNIKKILNGLKPIFVLLIFTFVFQIAFNTEGTLLVHQAMGLSYYTIFFMVVFTILWRILARLKKFTLFLFLAYVGSLYIALVYLNFDHVFYEFYFNVYESGVLMSVFVVVRLLVIIILSTALTISTKPTDLTLGLEKLLRPLKRIGLDSEEFALIISISLRYIPTILDEANKIMLAQASRGADFSEGKLKDKIKQVISLLVPMFIIAFNRSEDLAEAMESRNFVPGKPRTRIVELNFHKIDVLASVLIAICFIGAIVTKVVL